jgi:hypothetical protein
VATPRQNMTSACCVIALHDAFEYLGQAERRSLTKPRSGRLPAIASRSDVPFTLHGMTPEDVYRDVVFLSEFNRLHAPREDIVAIDSDQFRCLAVLKHDAGRATYRSTADVGNPMAPSLDSLQRGLAHWRKSHPSPETGETFPLHPFVNPIAMMPSFETVRYAGMRLIAPLDVSGKDNLEAADFRSIDDAGVVEVCRHLNRGEVTVPASDRHILDRDMVQTMVGASWSAVWAAFQSQTMVAAVGLSFGKDIVRIEFAGVSETMHWSQVERLIRHAVSKAAPPSVRWLDFGREKVWETIGGFADAWFSSARRVPQYEVSRGCVALTDTAQTTLDRRSDLLTVQAASPALFASYFRLRCDVSNIVWSGHATPPVWNDLYNWYCGRIADPASEIYLAMLGGDAIGYAYVNRHSDSIGTAIGVREDCAGSGIGERIVHAIANDVANRMPGQPIEAWIYVDNIASIKAHERAGYVLNVGRGERDRPAAAIDSTRMLCWSYRASGSQ